MILQGNEDLRIKKTITGIKAAFEEMVHEMGYENITVKELCERANINKKTFYRYYDTLDHLLAEMQEEISTQFFERLNHYSFPNDLDKVNEEFFLFSAEQDSSFEKITCIEPRIPMRDEMTSKFDKSGLNTTDQYQQLNDFEKTFLVGFVNDSVLSAYRQWVKDGKKVPLNDVVAMTNKILIGGTKGFFEQ